MPEESRYEAPREKPTTFQRWIEYVNYDWRRDSAGDLRNALLVVAALFVTVAFQAGINLPSHIFPDGDSCTQALFLASNTVLLSASTNLIHFLTGSLPFRREIRAAAWSLTATYGCSVGATTLPTGLKIPILLIPLGLWLLRWWVPCFKSSKPEDSSTSHPNQQNQPDQQSPPDHQDPQNQSNQQSSPDQQNQLNQSSLSNQQNQQVYP